MDLHVFFMDPDPQLFCPDPDLTIDNTNYDKIPVKLTSIGGGKIFSANKFTVDKLTFLRFLFFCHIIIFPRSWIVVRIRFE